MSRPFIIGGNCISGRNVYLDQMKNRRTSANEKNKLKTQLSRARVIILCVQPISLAPPSCKWELYSITHFTELVALSGLCILVCIRFELFARFSDMRSINWRKSQSRGGASLSLLVVVAIDIGGIAVGHLLAAAAAKQ